MRPLTLRLWCLLLPTFTSAALSPVVPLGPVQEVQAPLLAAQLADDAIEPVLLRAPALLAVLRRLGLDGFQQLSDHFGDSRLHFSKDYAFSSSVEKGKERRQGLSVKRYVHDLLEAEIRAPRLTENGGREFFLNHLTTYQLVAAAFANIAPEGYREDLLFGNSEEEDNDQNDEEDSNLDDLRVLAEAAAEGDVGVSALVLWMGDSGFTYSLHTDYAPAVLLTHLEGQKRIWLYPASQESLLYMQRPDDDENWEAVSMVPARDLKASLEARDVGNNDSEKPRWQQRFPLLEHATPWIIDLQPGETLLIPCGWAHMVEYRSAALSISCNLYPDWLTSTLEAHPRWSPSSCASFRPPFADGKVDVATSRSKGAEL